MMANLDWIVPLSIWLLVLLVIVPYRVANKYKQQRNEARALFQKQPVAPPLTNKTALFEVISEFRSEASNLMNYRIMQAMPAFFGASERSVRSIDELDKQKLVAGNAYKSSIDNLVIFVSLQVIMKLQESGTNNVLGKVKMDIELQREVDNAIRKIDEISGQVPDKEDYQA